MFQSRDILIENKHHQNASDFAKFFKALESARLTSRYVFKPTKTYSETIFKIIDRSMGKGAGLAVIHLDRGLRSGIPHLNINPKGYPCKKNPHIKVSDEVITAADCVTPWVQTISTIVYYAVIAYDVKRLYKAYKNDTDKELSKTLVGPSELTTTAYAVGMEWTLSTIYAKIGAGIGFFFLGPVGAIAGGITAAIMGVQHGNSLGKRLAWEQSKL